MEKIGVIGAGSFGTALAITLLNKGHDVTMWARRKEQIDELKTTHQNSHYLPGVEIPSGMKFTSNLEECVKSKDVLLFAVPTQSFRGTLEAVREFFPKEAIVVNVAKGIEIGTLYRLSEVASEVIPDIKYVALSGPSHAEEVARFLPTTVAVASKDKALSERVQEIFMTDRFRVYTNDDLVGVELAGSLKNIIALGAGISDGMGFGDNAKAAMMTRGITEMIRLGVSMGADVSTFSGLSGVGDLIVTCTSMHSRNRRCGIMIGEGKRTEDAIKEVGMVVEGISTAEAAYKLAQERGIEMPITECIYKLIHGDIDAHEAVEFLMGREKRNEMEI